MAPVPVFGWTRTRPPPGDLDCPPARRRRTQSTQTDDVVLARKTHATQTDDVVLAQKTHSTQTDHRRSAVVGTQTVVQTQTQPDVAPAAQSEPGPAPGPGPSTAPAHAPPFVFGQHQTPPALVFGQAPSFAPMCGPVLFGEPQSTAAVGCAGRGHGTRTGRFIPKRKPLQSR